MLSIFSAVRFCSVERLSRLAHLQNDIAREERMIDQHIDLLRGDKFDENTPTDSIEKGIAFFQVCFNYNYCIICVKHFCDRETK